jgi:hypothetical protein
VVGAAFGFVAGADWVFEFFFVGFGPALAFRFHAVALHLCEHGGGLFAAHDGDAGVGPGEEEARGIGAAAHAVIAGAERAADQHGEFRHFGGGDGGDHLGAILGDAAGFVFAADHEAGNVLQEEQRNAALARELDEVRRPSERFR